MVEIRPAGLCCGTGGNDEFGVIWEVELEGRVGESPDTDVSEALVKFDEQFRVRIADTRRRGRHFLNGFRFLAQSLCHVFCELIPEGEHTPLLILKSIRHWVQFLGNPLFVHSDLEVLWRNTYALDTLLAAVLKERHRGIVSGNELMPVGVGC